MRYPSFAIIALASLALTSPRSWAQGASIDLPPQANVPDLPEEVVGRHPLRIKPFVSSSPYGLTPAQVRHAYGFDQITGTGAGQTIAIVDAYGSPSLAKDLATFSTTYGLPAANLTVYYPQGQPATGDSGWALETSLDVQWAHAIAPAANIIVVVAKSASLNNLLKAVDYAVKKGAKQVSMSWGASEFSSESTYDVYFNKTGVSFFASSGDNGAGVSWPAASPYVVSVGGTTLQVDSAGNVISETGWSGSGGGVSAYVAKPSWQNNWSGALKRAVPDVSYNADPNTGVPVYITNYFGTTGWITVGGTSAGAPQWAALSALVNATRTTSLNSADSALYSSATGGYTTNFRDILSGNNGAYFCATSYDMVTGLGSPRAAALVPTLKTK